METALPQKFPFILDRNLAKANCTENRVCTSCDIVVLGLYKYFRNKEWKWCGIQTSSPISNLSAFKSMPMILLAPCALQPIATAKPTAPSPQMAQVEPASTCQQQIICLH